jgi:hypothetical protein
MTLRHSLLLIIFVGLVIVLAGSGDGNGSARTPQILEIEIRASGGTHAQLSWGDTLDFSNGRVVRVPLQAADGYQHLRFRMPPQGARWLRLETDASGGLWIRNVRLLDAVGNITAVLDPERLHPIQQIALMTREDDATHVVPVPGATNASVYTKLPSGDAGSFVDRMFLVTPFSLGLVSAAVWGLLIASAVAIGRTVLRNEPANSTLPSPWHRAAWFGILFLVVFSGSLLLMRQNPVTTPFWDQWDHEASLLYVPYHEGGLSWRAMFSLANEHRIFFTRLLALDLLTANGQWDPRFQQVVDAGLHAFTAVLLVAGLWLANDRRRLDLLVFIGALSFAPPFAWENVLSPIQSAAYLLILFSILALVLVAIFPPPRVAWGLGWLCAACALFTFGSGIFVPVALMGMAVMKWASARSGWRELAANMVAGGLVLGLGAALVSPPLAGHAPLKAGTIGAFAGALGHSLSWPWVDLEWPSVFIWLPMTAMLVGAIWRRGRTTTLERVAVGLAIWVALHAAALAYGRGAGAAQPATRYMDYLSLGLVANAMALVSIAERAGRVTATRRVAEAVLIGWLAVLAVGVERLVERNAGELSQWRQWFANHAANVRNLMVTGDYGRFMMQPPLSQLPYPDPGRLTTLLQDPYIRAILPSVVRTPIHVEPRLATSAGFARQQPQRGVPYDALAPAWWSLTEEGRGAVGRFESEPMTCGAGPRLQIAVSGYLGWPNQHLTLKEVNTGRSLSVEPSELAREQWREAIVPCPSGPFQIVAVDDARDSWFGFREPVETGRAMVLTDWLIAHSRGMLFTALALAFVAVRRTSGTSEPVRFELSNHV